MNTFSSRLGLLMLTLLSTSVGFMELYLSSYFEARAEDALVEHADGLADLTASSLGAALDFEDREGADLRLQAFAAVSEAQLAVAYDADGQEFARWSRPSGQRVDPRAPAGLSSDRRHYHARVPIPAKAAGAGALVLVLSTEALRQQQKEVGRVVIGASAVVMAIGLVLSVLLGSLLLRPINRVTALAKRISGGDLKSRDGLDLERKDEIGTMARALHGMLEILLDDRALLEAQNQASSEGILVAHVDGRLLSFNRRFCELWGFSEQELKAARLPEVQERLRALVCDAPAFLRGELDGGEVKQVPLKLKDGRSFLGNRARISRDGEERFATAYYFRDVSELRMVHEQLVVADRRASVGRLAAGVAHEVNNPLTFIMSNVDYAIEEIATLPVRSSLGAPIVDALSDTRAGAERVAYIVRALTELSRSDEGEIEPVDLGDCLGKMLAMAAHELKHCAEVRTHLLDRPALVDANGVRLGQVFLNLLINAGKAITPGQHQTIDVTLEARGDSEYSVTIRDTGCGMSPEVKARLFQPFFTTRGAGQGTGLGLSISMSIVQSYGGSISVESEVGKGSAFTVLLPASRSQLPKKRSTSSSSGCRRLRVAVVDDEPKVNAALRRALGAEHELTTLERGEDLLARLEAGQRFDALLSDLHMPGLSGPALYQRVRALDPALAERTIFMSGGAVTPEVKEFIEANQERLIPKPLDMPKLKAALASLAQRTEAPRA